MQRKGRLIHTRPNEILHLDRRGGFPTQQQQVTHHASNFYRANGSSQRLGPKRITHQTVKYILLLLYYACPGRSSKPCTPAQTGDATSKNPLSAQTSCIKQTGHRSADSKWPWSLIDSRFKSSGYINKTFRPWKRECSSCANGVSEMHNAELLLHFL